MKRTLLLLSFCVAMPVGSSWAAVVGSTNPTDFSVTTVDWCNLGGCAPAGTLAASTFAPNQPWLSPGGDAGFVDVTNLGASLGNVLYNLVAGAAPPPAPPPPPPPPPPSQPLDQRLQPGNGLGLQRRSLWKQPWPNSHWLCPRRNRSRRLYRVGHLWSVHGDH